MTNLLIFLGSCALIAGFAGWFSRLGSGGLIAWMAMLSLLANLFVLKQIDIFGLNATASDIFAIGGLFSLNLLREKYGKDLAQRAIWISFACLLFFVLMSQLHLLYVPSNFDTSQVAYEQILSASPRLLIASLVTFFIVDQCDALLYGTLRQRFSTFSPLLMNAIAMSLSQLLDTLLFSFLGLYGLIQAIGEIILISYTIKFIAIANTVLWSFMTQKLFRKNYAEKFD